MLLRNLRTPVQTAVRAGFTLMELLVVIAILLILVAVATPIYFQYVAKAKIDRARADCRTYAKALEEFAASHNQDPEFAATEGFPNVAEGELLWYLYNVQYLKQRPVDPWGTDYYAQIKFTANYVPYVVVYCAGPDRQFGTADDIQSEDPHAGI
jgi:general secretion pathway protein G